MRGSKQYGRLGTEMLESSHLTQHPKVVKWQAMYDDACSMMNTSIQSFTTSQLIFMVSTKARTFSPYAKPSAW